MMKIYVDAGIDLSLDRLKELNIGILYHSVVVDGEEKCSRIDLSHTEKLEYYNLVNKKIVKTSRPPLGETKAILEDEMKNGNDIVCLTMSSSLSGMYSTCSTISNILKMEYPNRTLTVIDTKAVGMEYGLLVLDFIECMSKGMDIDVIIRRLNRYLEEKRTGFIVALNTTNNFTSNGRLTGATDNYNIVESLNGTMTTVASYPTYEEAIGQLERKYNEVNLDNSRICIMNTCISNNARKLLDSFLEKCSDYEDSINPNMLVSTCIGADSIGFCWLQRFSDD